MKRRVAILVGVPTPYREPIFERLAASDQYETLVLYSRDRQPGQNWSLGNHAYPALCLKNYAPRSWHGRFAIGAINPGVLHALGRFRPDAIIVYGYNSLTNLMAMLWATLHPTPFLLRSDSNILDEQGKAWPRLAVKKILLKCLIKKASAILAVGTLNQAYWCRYGAAPENIVRAYYAVDNHFFQTGADQHRVDRQRIRHEARWSERFLLLYVGRLVVEKRVDVLIESMRVLSARRPDIGLLVVGDGPTRRPLEGLAREMPHVHFEGFRDQPYLPKYYGSADLLVLPSQCEQWGLVVNEAMASGLPVIATRKVGAARDLISNGENGYIVRENDPVALASAIDRACQSEQYLRVLGDRAQQTVQSWNYGSTLAGFHEALSRCFGTTNSPARNDLDEPRRELGERSRLF